MKLFDCSCEWRFIVGRKQVYGPIYEAPESASKAIGYTVYNQGRMMSREEFDDNYGDCALRFERQQQGVDPLSHQDCRAGEPCKVRTHPGVWICYEPHLDRTDHGLPNRTYQPHVHAPATDSAGRPVKMIWEDAARPPASGG